MFKRILVLFVALLAVACDTRPPEWTATVCLDPSLSEEYRAGMLSAADEWHGKSGGAVALTFRDGVGCDLDVRMAQLQDPDGGPRIGQTHSRHGDQDWIAFDADATADFDSEPREIALHELGHYLTGHSHSDDPSDIMTAHAVPGARGRMLTDADANRLWSVQ